MSPASIRKSPRFTLLQRACVLVLALWLPALVSAAEPVSTPPEVVLDPARDRFDVGGAVDFVVEATPLAPGQLSRAAWQRFQGRSINLRQQRVPVWFRFDIVVREPRRHDWLLEIPWPVLDLIELHLYDHTQQRWQEVQVAGNSVAPSQRSVEHRHAVFPLALPASGRVSVYLRVASLSHFNLPLAVWRSDAFGERDQIDLLLLGMLTGILFVMFLYNGLLYLFTRDRSYFFYSAYVLAILFFVLSVTGLGAQYLWRDYSWMRRHSFPLSAPLAYFTVALFVRQFLSLKSYGGWLLHLNTVIAAYWGLAVLAVLIGLSVLRQPLSQLSDLVGALSGIAGLVTTIAVWRRGNLSAKYFTIAWSLLIAANMMFALMLAGVLERNVVTAYSQLFGFVIEVVLLSLVLAERINRERLAREKAQAEALLLSQQIRDEREAKLAAQAEALVMQKAANEALEERVHERTAELQLAMESVERINLELRKLSTTDALTGAFNRHYFEKTFADELARAARLRHPLSVLLVDVDHFKTINDTYGHLVGDDCLRRIALALRKAITRAGDVVARYGGEEFVVLLPNTAPDNAVQVAEQLRGVIATLGFEAQGQRIALSASVGVAGWVPPAGERFEKLLSAADDALYQAKHQGRNRVVLAASVAAG